MITFWLLTSAYVLAVIGWVRTMETLTQRLFALAAACAVAAPLWHFGGEPLLLSL